MPGRASTRHDKNPLFQDGDQIYDGVIVRQVPEISSFDDEHLDHLEDAGAASARVEPAFLCGSRPRRPPSARW